MRITFLWSLLFVIIIAASCKKDKADNPPPGPATGETSPVGTPVGAIIKKTIGAAGGSIKTADGSIEVAIPQGALTTNTEISIQPISNTNIAGIGVGYRLLPHGGNFAKPVSLTFSYESMTDSIALPEALTVAYQDDKGVWRIAGDVQQNLVKKTLTITTTHFSDWIPMKWLDLLPQSKAIETGQSLTLRAVRYIETPDEDFLVVPLVEGKSKDIPVIKPVPLENKHIAGWQLGGNGELKPSGNTAVYTAPQSVIAGNSAAVSLEVKSPGIQKRWLVANIEILTEEYLMYRINGGPWKSLHGVFGTPQEGLFGIAGSELDNTEDIPLVITWEGGAGTHNWHEPNDDNTATFGYWLDDGSYYTQVYDTPDEVYERSPGSLSVPKINPVTEYTTGTFRLEKAGHYKDGDYAGSVSIEGKFKLKLFKFY